MTAFLRSLPPRRRTATLLGWGLLIASPFLLLAAVSLAIGRNAFATYPVWSDELDYWRNLFTWDAVGFHTGYNGMLEERLTEVARRVEGLERARHGSA